MTTHEMKKVVEGALAPYDRIESLECDGFTRVASHILNGMGINHVTMFGSLKMFGYVVEPHYWIVLEDTGLVVDYRARMWLDDKPEAPHGVFMEEDFPLAVYCGDETKLLVNKVVFDVLTRNKTGEVE